MKIHMGGRSLKDVLKSEDGAIVRNALITKYPELKQDNKETVLNNLFGKGKWKELDKDDSGTIEPNEVPSAAELKNKFTVKELKAELKKLGLDIKGKEDELIERLRKFLKGE